MHDKTKDWNWQFTRLKGFRELYPGRWPRNTAEYPAGNPLGKWYARQLKAYQQDALTPYQILQLLRIECPVPMEKSSWQKRQEMPVGRERYEPLCPNSMLELDFAGWSHHGHLPTTL